jgi:hypothetical protein
MQGLILGGPGYNGAPPPGAQLIHSPYGYQILGPLPSFHQPQASLSGLETVPSGGGNAGLGPADESTAAGGGGGGGAGPPLPASAVATAVSTMSNNNNSISSSSLNHQHADKAQAN